MLQKILRWVGLLLPLRMCNHCTNTCKLPAMGTDKTTLQIQLNCIISIGITCINDASFSILNTELFGHRFQMLICWHLFTDLFRLSLHVRIKCCNLSQLQPAISCRYEVTHFILRSEKNSICNKWMRNNCFLNFVCISKGLCIVLTNSFLWNTVKSKEHRYLEKRAGESVLCVLLAMFIIYHNPFEECLRKSSIRMSYLFEIIGCNRTQTCVQLCMSHLNWLVWMMCFRWLYEINVCLLLYLLLVAPWWLRAKTNISGTRNTLSWTRGLGFAPWSGWTLGVLSLCLLDLNKNTSSSARGSQMSPLWTKSKTFLFIFISKYYILYAL